MALSFSFSDMPSVLLSASAFFFAALSLSADRFRLRARASATFLMGFEVRSWKRCFIESMSALGIGSWGR